MIEADPASAAPPRNPALLILFIAGPILFVGGIIAMIIDRTVIAHYDALGSSTHLQTLPVMTYTHYYFPPANPAIPDSRLMPVFVGVAIVGLLVLIVAIALHETVQSTRQGQSSEPRA
jgi:hypothetical protein